MLQMTIAGRIGRDAETRRSQAGDSYTGFSVAVDMGKDKTEWVSCTIKGERGEKLCQYLKKGVGLAITGLPVADLYTPKDGSPRASLKLWVDKLTFLSKAKSEGDAHEIDNHDATERTTDHRYDGLDDEIPF